MWLWRPIVKDKSRLSSTLFSFKDHREVTGSVFLYLKFSLFLLFFTTRFSTDEGQCWKLYNFTDQPFFFAGLASEPGTNAMTVSVWGFRPEEDGQPMWVAVTIDFQSLITRECKSNNIYDYCALFALDWFLWHVATWW